MATGSAVDLQAAGNHEMALLLMKMASRSLHHLRNSASNIHHSLVNMRSEGGKGTTTKLTRSAIRMNKLGQN